MANCNLCKKKKADKKGSHVVPHILLKRVENIDEKTGRDYEMGFKIESLNSSSHFGRAIQPERLKETPASASVPLVNTSHVNTKTIKYFSETSRTLALPEIIDAVDEKINEE